MNNVYKSVALLCILGGGVSSGVALSQSSSLGEDAAHREDLAPAGKSSSESMAASVISVSEAETQDRIGSQDKIRLTNRVIEEVVVTTQKREESLQSVPIAISAFSDSQLAALGVKDTSDLQQLVPSLSITGSVGFSVIYLRGIGSDAFLPTIDPAVATYVDGMYVPANQGVFTSLAAVERVEVVKGPQGTLFGRNAVAGAISVTSKKPNLEKVEASALVEIGSYNGKKAQGTVSIPLAESLAFSMSGLYQKEDSYYDVVPVDSVIYPKVDYSLAPNLAKGWRGAVLWAPLDNFTASVTGFHIESDTSRSVAALTNPSALSQLLLLPTTDEPYETNWNAAPVDGLRHNLISGEVNWSLVWLDAKAIVGYQKIISKAVIDFDGSQANLVTFTATQGFNELKTAELQLISNENTPGPDWFRFVAGLYALEQDAGYPEVYLGVAGTGTAMQDPLFGLVPEAIYEQLLAGIVPGFVPLPVGPVTRVVIEGLLHTEAVSGYAQADFDLTDTITVTLGGRYSSEERSVTRSQTSVDDAGGGTFPVLKFSVPDREFTNFSPKITGTYKFSDDVLVYATWAQGFKSGTYNVVSIYTPPGYVEPEKITSYEVGVKSTLLDGTLRLNGAIFDNTLKNQQVQYVSLTNGGAVSIENAGEGQSRGIEADLIWQPLPAWNPGFAVTGGGSYLDATYPDFVDASGFDEVTGLFRRDFDYSGNRVAKTAKVTGNMSVSQTFEVSKGIVEIVASGYHNSGFYYTAQNTDRAKQGAYTLVDGRVSYLYDPWGLQFTVFGKNLTDKAYTAGSFTADFGTTYTYAAPRVYGVRLEWSF